MASTNIENTAGIGVNTHYGRRGTESGILGGGKLPSVGGEQELVIYIKGDEVTEAGVPTAAYLPAGAVFISARIDISEAFNLTGTSPTINVGTYGSAGTNYGIEVNETNAEAGGVFSSVSGSGTWGSALAARTRVGVELDGTSPVSTGPGQARVVIRYAVV